MTGQQFAKGGIITGPHSDVVPAFIELGCAGYVISARVLREIGGARDLLAKLNASFAAESDEASLA